MSTLRTPIISHGYAMHNRCMRSSRFPDIVDDVTVRLIAAVVLLVSAATLATQQWWLLALLAVDFTLRATLGPRHSPVARLVQAWIRVPSLPAINILCARRVVITRIRRAHLEKARDHTNSPRAAVAPPSARRIGHNFRRIRAVMPRPLNRRRFEPGNRIRS